MEEFLQEYKRLESLLDIPVFEYEQQLQNDIDKNKLKLCRSLRNYIQHNNHANQFIRIHPAQTEFLAALNRQLQREQCGTAEDAMITLRRYGMVYDTDTVQEAAMLITKKQSVIVLDQQKHVVGICDEHTICKAFADGCTKTTKLKKYVEPTTLPTIEATACIQSLDNTIDTIVVNTKQKPIGVIPKLHHIINTK